MAGEDTSRPGRQPGQRAGLSRERIVRAARSLEPSRLTMQEVASRLGVDRSTLNHHVHGREGLLRLVAVSSFQSHFALDLIDLRGSWETAITSWTRAMVAGLVAVGDLVDYFEFSPDDDNIALRAADSVARKLMGAGFGTETAGHALYLAASFAFAHARNEVMQRRSGLHPQVAEVKSVLDLSGQDHYDALRALLAAQPQDQAGRQMEFALRVLVEGIRVVRRDPSPA